MTFVESMVSIVLLTLFISALAGIAKPALNVYSNSQKQIEIAASLEFASVILKKECEKKIFEAEKIESLLSNIDVINSVTLKKIEERKNVEFYLLCLSAGKMSFSLYGVHEL